MPRQLSKLRCSITELQRLTKTNYKDPDRPALVSELTREGSLARSNTKHVFMVEFVCVLE